MGEGIMTGSTSFLDSNFKADLFHQDFPFDFQEFCPIESGKNWALIFCSTWKCRWNEPFLRPILGHLGRRVSQFSPCFPAWFGPPKGIGIKPHGELREAWHMGKCDAQNCGKENW